jgi:hypothetical protein
MKAVAIVRLHRLLGLARNAEALRLAGVMAKMAACRGRAARLRGEIGGAGVAATQGDGRQVAADLAAVSHWGLRLDERARAEEARAMELEAEAAAIRRRLARAVGRESAAAAMAENALAEERRLAAVRAEAAVVAPAPAPASARAPDHPASSGSKPVEISAGSPGTA